MDKIDAQIEKIHDKGDIVVSLQIHCLDDEYYLSYKLPMEGGTRPLSYDEYKNIIDVIRGKHIQPSKPESECKCKGGRHCEVCRKADSCGAGIEKLNEVSPEVRDNINPDIVNLWDKLNEVIDRINKQ